MKKLTIIITLALTLITSTAYANTNQSIGKVNKVYYNSKDKCYYLLINSKNQYWAYTFTNKNKAYSFLNKKVLLTWNDMNTKDIYDDEILNIKIVK